MVYKMKTFMQHIEQPQGLGYDYPRLEGAYIYEA